MVGRKVITVNEVMEMPHEELTAFIENDKRLISENIGSVDCSNVDFMGMSIKEVAKKYGCISEDELVRRITEKFGI